MNTTLSFRRAGLLALALGTASATVLFAQSTSTSSTTTTPTAPTDTTGSWQGHHHHDSILTADERAQLKKDHEAVLAANSTLAAQAASLKQQFETLKGEGSSATSAQWQALHQQKETFQSQLRSAELNLDPSLAPIFAKLDAAKAQWHHGN
jgi:hypothetical protein